jgi:hypothetical protein
MAIGIARWAVLLHLSVWLQWSIMQCGGQICGTGYAGGVNLALGISPEVSSDYHPKNKVTGKHFLTDGDHYQDGCPGDNHFWTSQFNTDTSNWAKVSLNETACVRQIKIWTRCGCCSKQMRKAMAHVQVNGSWVRCSKGKAIDVGLGKSFTFHCSLQGTAVRVRKFEDAYLSFSELQVFGELHEVKKACSSKPWNSTRYGPRLDKTSTPSRFNATQKAGEVQCCNDAGTTCTRKDSKGQCLSGHNDADMKTYEEAVTLCSSMGMRLCKSQ